MNSRVVGGVGVGWGEEGWTEKHLSIKSFLSEFDMSKLQPKWSGEKTF